MKLADLRMLENPTSSWELVPPPMSNREQKYHDYRGRQIR